MAVFMSLGNLGGIAGSNIFPEEEKPQYRTGYGCMQEDDGRFGYVSAWLVEQLRSTPVSQVNIYISTDEVIRSQIGRPLLFNRSAKGLATEIENTAPDWSKRQEKVHLATNLDTFSAGLHGPRRGFRRD
jgi:hypothetical protein